METAELKEENKEPKVASIEAQRQRNQEIIRRATEIAAMKDSRLDHAEGVILGHPLTVVNGDLAALFKILDPTKKLLDYTNNLDACFEVKAERPSSQHMIRCKNEITGRYIYQMIQSNISTAYIKNPDLKFYKPIINKYNVMTGIIYTMTKIDNDIPYHFIAYMPVDSSKKKKFYAYLDKNRVFALDQVQPEATVPIVVKPAKEYRKNEDPLTERDKALISEKYTRESESQRWRTINDAIIDINALMNDTIDSNYIYRLLSLNCELSYAS
jgi:hypothetical protein